MKYKYDLEIRNETDKGEIFDRYKDAIYEHILAEIADYFDFDLDLLVVFRELDKQKQFINDETYNGGTTLVDNKYAVILNISSLEAIPNDGGFDFALSVHHELCHVYDLHQAMRRKHHPINPLYKSYKTLKDFTISKGWMVWTEFHAYFLTYKKFSEDYDCPTLLQIVNGYENLSAQLDKIKKINNFDAEESKTIIYDFIDNIEDFIYFTAKYLAGVSFCDQQNEDCDEKTEESDAYKSVNKIFVGIMKKILPLVKNSYGILMTKKLYKLGEYLLKAVYAEFDIFPVDCDGQVLFAYCD
ncbi:MAG: hypothetical protein K2O28_00270 [Clostridia bacterium]|nr:hypothetical protein [Clostridia bacterium]